MIPLILSALPGLIQMAEVLITKGKSGSDKKDLVLQQTRLLLEKLIATNIIPEVKVTDDTLVGLIEAKLAELKATNSLTTIPTPMSGVVQLIGIRGTYVKMGEI